MIKAKITTYQDEYHVIKIHWSDVQGFWFKTEQERDMEYIERRNNE